MASKFDFTLGPNTNNVYVILDQPSNYRWIRPEDNYGWSRTTIANVEGRKSNAFSNIIAEMTLSWTRPSWVTLPMSTREFPEFNYFELQGANGGHFSIIWVGNSDGFNWGQTSTTWADFRSNLSAIPMSDQFGLSNASTWEKRII